MHLRELLKNKSILTSLITGLICGALSYWFQPYNDRFVLGMDIYILMGLLTFLASLLIGLAFIKPGFIVPLYLCVGFVASVMGRIFYDITFIEKSHHNLWPLEILFVLGVILPASLAGSLIAYLIYKLRR